MISTLVVCGHVLATVRGALAVAPGIESDRTAIPWTSNVGARVSDSVHAVFTCPTK